ncbi:Hypothetical protein FKW44_024055 [Caligus rogercresseyi]|uniref:Uncharacterized protein n=1 Tax=Caligus rogercresseyi TaxID=217165 RepID=A0A7T8GQH9_CALRO|nr:Hypothetical protein FKW44_024055 [Caligus rogercresseyi]
MKAHFGLHDEANIIVVPFIATWRGIIFSRSMEDIKRQCHIPPRYLAYLQLRILTLPWDISPVQGREFFIT